MKIRKIIRKIQNLGLNYTVINKHEGTCYVQIGKKGFVLFIIRFSDHDLRPNNQLPAGVINLYKESVNFISENLDVIDLYLREYKLMTKKEKIELWKNRLIIKDPEYPSLLQLDQE